ncbi:hypothetical protein Tco_0218711 [Tanacetum coccineum]
MVLGYKTGLELVEEKLEFYKKNESVYVENINGLKWDIQVGEITIRELRKNLEKIQKEKDSIQFNVDKFENASNSLNKLIECQIVDNCKKGLGYEKYNAVPPPYIENFMPPTPDFSFTGLDEFVNKLVIENIKSDEEVSKVVRKSDDSLIIEDWVSDSKEENVSQTKTEKKIVKPSIAKIEFVKPKQQRKLLGKLLNNASITLKKFDILMAQGISKFNGCLGSQKETDFYSIVMAINNWFYMIKEMMIVMLRANDMEHVYLQTWKRLDGDILLWRDTLMEENHRKSRFTWVFFLATKDETSGILKSFITGIENLVDHKVKVDEGFFVGYSLNSKAFRVFNSRTRIVEENLHIRFSESTPNVVDQARKETEPVKDYILLPLWTADTPYSQDPKSSHDDRYKPSKKEDNVNSTNNVNAASTNEVNVVGEKTSIELLVDPNMPALEDYSIFDVTKEGEDYCVVDDYCVFLIP